MREDRQSKLKRLVAAAGLALMAIGVVPAQAAEITIATRSEMTMDPHFFWSTPNRAYNVQLYGSLVRLDERIRVQPMLAKSWELVDETTWDFQLDPEARFHNGEPVTAADVVASFDRALNLPNAAASYKGALRGVTGFEAVDQETVRFKTAKPNPALLHQIAQVAIIPAGVAGTARQADFISGKAAIGAGPYRFVEFKPGDRLVLERNDKYFGDQPKWDKVVFRVISDDAARVAALLGGDVEVIDYVPPVDVARLEADPNIAVHKGTTDRTMYLIPDTGRNQSPYVLGADGKPLVPNPMLDFRVRKAMAMAIDRQALVDRVMDGAGVPANQNVAPAVLGYAEGMPPLAFDLDQARNLMAEAGYADGFDLTIHCTNDRYVNDGRLCQAIGQMLARLGLRMTVEALPKAVMFPKIRDHQGDRTSLMMLSFGSGTSGDAGGALTHTIHSYAPDRGFGTWNIGHYSNAEIDALIEEAAATLDAEKRGQVQSQAVKRAIEDLAVIPLFYTSVIVASRKGLEYQVHADQSTIADSVSKSE